MCLFFCVLLQLSKFSSDVQPTGRTADRERTAAAATAVVMMPRRCCFTASQTTIWLPLQPCLQSFQCFYSLRVMRHRLEGLHSYKSLLLVCFFFFNNNHVKLLQLAHSSKYTEKDVEGKDEGLGD